VVVPNEPLEADGVVSELDHEVGDALLGEVYFSQPSNNHQPTFEEASHHPTSQSPLTTPHPQPDPPPKGF